MKAIFKSLFGIFAITATITHIWTTIIAIIEAGIFGGILTLIFPVASEIYWIIKMVGVNNTFVWIALIHLILAIPFAALSK